MPEVRIAANTLTLFRFDATIDRASVEVEGRTTRFRVVDALEAALAEKEAALAALQSVSAGPAARNGPRGS